MRPHCPNAAAALRHGRGGAALRAFAVDDVSTEAPVVRDVIPCAAAAFAAAPTTAAFLRPSAPPAAAFAAAPTAAAFLNPTAPPAAALFRGEKT